MRGFGNECGWEGEMDGTYGEGGEGVGIEMVLVEIPFEVMLLVALYRVDEQKEREETKGEGRGVGDEKTSEHTGSTGHLARHLLPARSERVLASHFHFMHTALVEQHSLTRRVERPSYAAPSAHHFSFK